MEMEIMISKPRKRKLQTYFICSSVVMEIFRVKQVEALFRHINHFLLVLQDKALQVEKALADSTSPHENRICEKFHHNSKLLWQTFMNQNNDESFLLLPLKTITEASTFHRFPSFYQTALTFYHKSFMRSKQTLKAILMIKIHRPKEGKQNFEINCHVSRIRERC
ncbi:CLUMA_CG014708, isoform A [Clunio marinus]|uniref:CLUMA_CG014708, isoform A n=1 Tax=Clunio marinus TaxID=568069 RepID=A0A1J1IQP0_9DIPT|nr:CLUMA_CG014708, isoform A [Clunio marinus]